MCSEKGLRLQVATISLRLATVSVPELLVTTKMHAIASMNKKLQSQHN